ncbi:MAG: hypothetical protein IIC84_03130 [Chloroflexi bacterium]|nr:hypothetical protein [Chloroflexota bacterium]
MKILLAVASSRQLHGLIERNDGLYLGPASRGIGRLAWEFNRRSGRA